MKLVIDIPEEVYTFIRNVWKDVESDKRSPFSELCKAVENGKPLPKDPTNGDMIKAIFPKYYQTVLWYLGNTKWWNSPYKEEDDM